MFKKSSPAIRGETSATIPQKEIKDCFLICLILLRKNSQPSNILSNKIFQLRHCCFTLIELHFYPMNFMFGCIFMQLSKEGRVKGFNLDRKIMTLSCSLLCTKGKGYSLAGQLTLSVPLFTTRLPCCSSVTAHSQPKAIRPCWPPRGMCLCVCVCGACLKH